MLEFIPYSQSEALDAKNCSDNQGICAALCYNLIVGTYYKKSMVTALIGMQNNKKSFMRHVALQKETGGNLKQIVLRCKKYFNVQLYSNPVAIFPVINLQSANLVCGMLIISYGYSGKLFGHALAVCRTDNRDMLFDPNAGLYSEHQGALDIRMLLTPNYPNLIFNCLLVLNPQRNISNFKKTPFASAAKSILGVH